MSVYSLSIFQVPFQRAIDGAENLLERRRIIIAINLAFMQMVICVALYFLMRIVTKENPIVSFTPLLIVATIVTLYLIRDGKYKLARLVNLLALNVLLFFLSQRLGSSTGVNYYYVAAGAASIVLYGFEDWKIGVSIATLSLVLFLLNDLVVLEFVPRKQLTAEQQQLFTILNTTLTFCISSYCLVMMMKLNYESEKVMLEKQSIIELQIEELKKANSELDRFVYSASHDLRAPLSSISGLITVIEQEKSAFDSHYISLIKDRVLAMDLFIKDIVNYSRNARLEPELKNFSLAELTNEVVKALAYFENSKKVNFKIDISDDFLIYSDKDRIKIVLNNLLTNSLKYADFTKENSFIEVNALNKEDAVIIEIKDNGIGIDEVHKDKVFDMFYRATDRSKGSGLGLYITKEVIEKLSGKISMHSEKAKGTTFTIELPEERNNT